MRVRTYLGISFAQAISGTYFGLGNEAQDGTLDRGYSLFEQLRLADAVATHFTGLVGASRIEAIDEFQQLLEVWQMDSAPEGGSLRVDEDSNLWMCCQMPEGILKAKIPLEVHPYLESVLSEADKVALARLYFLADMAKSSTESNPPDTVRLSRVVASRQDYVGQAA